MGVWEFVLVSRSYSMHVYVHVSFSGRINYHHIFWCDCRLVFSELRLGVEFLSRHPRCPSAVSSILIRGVAFVSGLAPAQQMRREA